MPIARDQREIIQRAAERRALERKQRPLELVAICPDRRGTQRMLACTISRRGTIERAVFPVERGAVSISATLRAIADWVERLDP